MGQIIKPLNYTYIEVISIEENEIIVITREHEDLFCGKYNMIKEDDYYRLGVTKNEAKDIVHDIIIDLCEMDIGVLLLSEDSTEEIIDEIVEEIIEAAESIYFVKEQ